MDSIAIGRDVTAARILQFGVTPDEYVGFRSGAVGRDMAASLCRRYTWATLRELSERFGPEPPGQFLGFSKGLIRVTIR